MSEFFQRYCWNLCLCWNIVGCYAFRFCLFGPNFEEASVRGRYSFKSVNGLCTGMKHFLRA